MQELLNNTQYFELTDKPYLLVMCGIQGSGKSTIAKQFSALYKAVVISSDTIRKEHPELTDNDKVFRKLYADVNFQLRHGENVILDATNITIKSRQQIFLNIKGVDCYKYCYIINTDYVTCVNRVIERNKDNESHFVPTDVIKKYLYSFEIPYYEEGWDKIFIHNVSGFNSKKYEFIVHKMNEFNQKCKYHKHLLGIHCDKVSKSIIQLFDISINNSLSDFIYTIQEQQRDRFLLMKSAELHDVGKLYTQTFDDEGFAHYYNHENVGAYYLLCNTDLIDCEAPDLLDILFYVNYHMKAFTWSSEKSKTKWSKLFGYRKYKNLITFNEADKQSCF